MKSVSESKKVLPFPIAIKLPLVVVIQLYLTVVPDRVARAFNRSGATRAVALDISMAFDRVWHVGLLHKPYGISGQIFSLISSFLSKLRVVLDGKSSQEHQVTLFLLYNNDLPDDVICNIAIYTDDTTLYSKCYHASDLWQQLELASELQSDLRDTGLGQGVDC